MITLEEMREYLWRCEFGLGEKYNFEIYVENDIPFLRATYDEVDISTGEIEVQKTRPWRLSYHMVKSEIVTTAFKCALTSAEHRTREHFLYRGRRIFGPHFDVDSLWEIANKKSALDYRGK